MIIKAIDTWDQKTKKKGTNKNWYYKNWNENTAGKEDRYQ